MKTDLALVRAVPSWWHEVARLHKSGMPEKGIARKLGRQRCQINLILDQPAARFRAKAS